MSRQTPYWKTPRFKRLQSQWEKKLVDSGFKDIERGHQGGPREDLSQRIHFRPGIKELTENYFTWATDQLARKFKTRQHRVVWVKHAEGKSAAGIGRELGLSRWRISDIISEVREYLKETQRATEKGLENPSTLR